MKIIHTFILENKRIFVILAVILSVVMIFHIGVKSGDLLYRIIN